jgi:transposase-like protein
LERHGDNGSTIRMRIVGGTKRRELFGIMKEEVEARSQVFTDALPSYASMNHVFVHKFIDHAESYAKGNVHTNGLENFWSLLKRSIKGTYVSVEPFHMFRYLDEQAFRFNTRKQSDANRFGDVAKRVTGRRLTYKALTGHTDETGRTQ